MERKTPTVVTLPNIVSLSRVVVTPVMVWAVLENHGVVALGLFCLVVTSDMLDGFIARRTGQETRLGTLLDHGADATFVVSVTGLCAYLGLLPPLLPALIAIAFIQYVLDSHVFAGASLRPSAIGRWNGIAYFVVAGTAIVVHHYLSAPGIVVALRAFGWLLVASTVFSIAQRTIHLAGTARGS
jgi:cardiolipin synthase